MTVAVVLLAAGQSSRMGFDKLMYSINGQPVLRHAANQALAAEIGPVFVVLGAAQEARRTSLSGLDVRIVENPDAARGLATSVSAAIKALPSNCDGAIISLADLPFLAARHFKKVNEAVNPESPARLVDATGKPGHPVWLPAKFFDRANARSGNAGLQEILDPNITSFSRTEDDSPTFDLDTPSDVQEFERRLQNQT